MSSPGSAGSVSGGERKLVTMLFADLSGYTALAEAMDAEDVYALIGPTMLELQRIAESYGGTVPLIQGDGFMAVFGVPRAHEDDAERAVRAALAVRDRMRELNRRRGAAPLPEVHAGVNSGEVMVAPSAEPAGFTVIGDTVNTASRIGGLATAGRVLVSEETRRLTAETIDYGPARRRRAKGKIQPLVTFEALGVSGRARTPRPVVAFVDRTDPLALLGRELETAERTRTSRVLLVTGEAGIGKSRLALELGASLSKRRFLVGRCSPFGDRPPLSALAEAVGEALGVSDGAPGEVHAALEREARRIAQGGWATLAADLRALLSVPLPGESRSEHDALRAARVVIEHLAGEGTVALVLDDLHSADPSLIELLRHLHRAPWPVPLFVVGLSREAIDGLPSTPLQALDDVSMRSIAESMLGSDAPEQVIAAPVARANGNALFLEAIVGMLVEAGAVAHEGDRWQLVDPEALQGVPATIRLVIAARLDALPAEHKRLLHDAAVCGPTTWDRLLEAMGDGPVAEVLSDLVERDLLYEQPHSSIAGARGYAFTHALVRDVAYEAVPKASRAAGHLAVARWLRETSPDGQEPVGAVAHHYARAWELLQRRRDEAEVDEVGRLAAEYLTRSAEEMYARQARAAEPLFRRALRAAEPRRDVDPCPAARAAVGLAEVLIEMGAHREAIERATVARRLAERAGDEDLAARALLALGRAESDLGRMPRARTLLLDARRRFEAEGDLRGQGWAMHRLSETWTWEGFDRQLDDLRESYRLFTRARDRFGRAVAAHDLAYILSVEGGPEFRRWYATVERLADNEGDLRSRALLARTWGYHCYASGRFTEAVQAMAVCRPLAIDAGDRYAEADALTVGALAGVTTGDPAGVVSSATEALALGRELGSLRTPALARLAIARASLRAGDRGSASRALKTARDAVRSNRARVMYADVAEAEAMFALDRGAWGLAQRHARSLAAALDAVPMALWEPLPSLIAGRALLGSGQPREAAVALEEASRRARAVGAVGASALSLAYRREAVVLSGMRTRREASPGSSPREPEAAAVVAETIGIEAIRGGRVPEAIEAFDLAVDHWERGGSSAWLARATALRAEAFAANGDRARAAASRSRAHAIADDVGMPSSDRATIDRPLG